jgi:hypothetical protein
MILLGLFFFGKLFNIYLASEQIDRLIDWVGNIDNADCGVSRVDYYYATFRSNCGNTSILLVNSFFVVQKFRIKNGLMGHAEQVGLSLGNCLIYVYLASDQIDHLLDWAGNSDNEDYRVLHLL